MPNRCGAAHSDVAGEVLGRSVRRNDVGGRLLQQVTNNREKAAETVTVSSCRWTLDS